MVTHKLSSVSTAIQFVGFLFLFSINVVVESETFWGDIQVLKELKYGLDNNSVSPGSCLSSWDFALDPCDSLFRDKFTCGFRCDLVVSNSSRVTELSLDQAGYAGQLVNVSWNLPYLQLLELSNNNFYGPIPDSLANLSRLTRLSLSRNWFSGEIPNSLGSLTSLEEMYLDYNLLEGKIPESFNGLTALKRLEIQSNKLFGEFPDLGSIQNLYFIDASNNYISQNPLTNLPSSLIQISMRNNTIGGQINPETLTNLNYLQVLDLSHNRLNGSIPPLLFTHPSLQQLTLSFNNFNSIETPKPQFTNPIQSELIALDLSNNDIHGMLPHFIATLSKLSALSLENNKFTGLIPTQYAIKAVVPVAGVSPLSRLLLGGNYLFGPIPGPLMVLKPGSINVRISDNCFYRCPVSFFFCQDGDQKSTTECKRYAPGIP